ncbi:MAG TPA: hypothetical protein VGU63_11455 [Candidatus Acidoferrales bacterium]|nr:hypothetical protein [Candidatus Acidoferrales bacterium]
MHFVSGAPPHLAVHVEYRLANVGNASLHFIAVELPGEKEFGRANLRAQVDGNEITPQHNPAEAADDWRIPFAAPWHQREKTNLTLAYDLAAQPATDPRIFVASNALYLNDSGWLPVLLGFKALLSPSITRPNPTDLTIIVPANFLVTASGQTHGEKKLSAETEFRFRLRTGDPEPFVAAGAYHLQRISASGMSILFWTLEPLPSAALENAANSLASIDSFLVTTFDAHSAAGKSLLVLQAPAPGPPSGATPLDKRSVTLPGIIVLWPAASSTDLPAQLASEGLKELLARSRFEHVITPRPEAWLLGDSLASFAVMLANEKSGVPPPRAELIRQRIAHFDQLGNEAAERPIALLTSGDTAQQREMGRAKSALFLFALEDRCGRENVEHALAHMVYALQGQGYGYTDLRVALEQECHQDLSSMFATWLDQKGIPADFRARYAGENKSAK